MQRRGTLACLLIAALVGGCGAGDTGLVIGVGSGGDTGSGRIDLALTDAPVDEVTAVVLSITGVELEHVDGRLESIEFSSPRPIDLLALSGGASAVLLNDRPVAAGGYRALRLRVDAAGGTSTASRVETLLGGSLPLAVAGDPGLRMVQDFSVPAGATADLLVDVDLRKGLSFTTGDPEYVLGPSLRLIDRATAGSVRGAIRQSLITDLHCSSGPGDDVGNVVYLYSAAGATPDDIDGDSGDPLTSAEVISPALGVYVYTIPWLPPGAYTVAFSCQAALDDPLSDNALIFSSVRDVSVEQGFVTTQDL